MVHRFNSGTDWIDVYFDGEPTPRIHSNLDSVWGLRTVKNGKQCRHFQRRFVVAICLAIPKVSDFAVSDDILHIYNIGYDLCSPTHP